MSQSDHSEKEDASLPVDEGPALSHAQRRKLKRKREREDLESLHTVVLDAPPSSKFQPPASSSGKGKRQNSVWVGNLHFKTTEDDLRKFFADAGEVTRVNMPVPNDDAQKIVLLKKKNKG